MVISQCYDLLSHAWQLLKLTGTTCVKTNDCRITDTIITDGITSSSDKNSLAPMIRIANCTVFLHDQCKSLELPVY
jgi:hypothetical protein